MRDVQRRQWGDGSDDLLALEWASVGRLVRRTTLEAVAVHFAFIGAHATRTGRSVAADEGNKREDR